ncbi:MAG: glycine zipper domain-containing protein [Acidobacteriota bacterium]|nr:glycine zipper domain-containing protein [Acidobacteriota bacterium]
MKRTLWIALTIALAWTSPAPAQNPPQPAPTGQKTLAATINVYVFPADGQTTEQQSRDEAECYAWAVSNTRTDPFDLAKQEQQQAQSTEQQRKAIEKSDRGAGLRGALRGAAVGALIGEIANDDPGDGAAWGAAAGAIRGRRKARRNKQQASSELDRREQSQQQATAKQIEDFKKAFSVCLEAKGYLVKF